MFSRVSNTVRHGLKKRSHVVAMKQQQTRKMGGGGHFLEISERHTWWGEAFGVFCWLWIFHRARQDLPVVLGFRHAWEHAPGDDYQGHGHHAESDGKESQKNGWDKFSVKAMQQIDDDDDDDDEEEEDDNDDDEE